MFSQDSPFSATFFYEFLRLTGDFDGATALMLRTVVSGPVEPGLCDVLVDVGGRRES